MPNGRSLVLYALPLAVWLSVLIAPHGNLQTEQLHVSHAQVPYAGEQAPGRHLLATRRLLL